MNRRSAVAALAVLVGIVPTALMAPAPSASAFVTSGGSGRGSFPVGTLEAPSDVTATADGPLVDVAWSPVPPPAGGALGYYVTRTTVGSGPTVDVCGSPASPLADTPTSCTDSAVPDGTYTYSVTAVSASWTSTGTPSDPVQAGDSTSTTTLDPSTSTATTGAEDSVSFGVTVLADGTTAMTGTVDVSVGPVTLCTVSLPDTSCSPGPSALAPSDTPYQVVATYGGSDGVAGSDSSPQDLTVFDAPDITTTSLAPARAGETGYQQQLTATGGMADLTWSNSGPPLPSGLTLDPFTGVIAGTLDPGDATTILSLGVSDGNGAEAFVSLTLTVTDPLSQQIAGHTGSDTSTIALTLSLPVVHGDALVLTVDQACLKSAGSAVDSHVTGVSGASVTWTRATATGCGADGDAELWYGLGAAGAAAGAKVTVTLAASAPVQFADVSEYAGIGARDTGAAATTGATGTAAATTPGGVAPTGVGELVVSTTFVTRPTPHGLSTLVGPFVPLSLVTPYQGLGVYAVDATTATLTPTYTQTVAGAPTAGPWASVATAFAFTS
jgi:hypothetical protein